MSVLNGALPCELRPRVPGPRRSLSSGLDVVENGLAEEQPFCRTFIVRVLRIIHRVLEVQDILLDVFLPLLAVLSEPTRIDDVPPVS